MFKHEWLPDEAIDRVDSDGSRFYKTKSGIFPSITAILGATSDKTALNEWIKKVGEEEAKKIGRRATTRGTKNHALWESYLKNEEIPEIKIPSLKESFNQLTPIFDERISVVRALEKPLYSETLRVAGTVDCVAEFDGIPSIIDFKTSSNPKPKEWITNYFVQACAYSIMVEEMYGLEIPQIVILMEVQSTGEPIIFVEEPNKWIPDLIYARETYYKLFKK